MIIEIRQGPFLFYSPSGIGYYYENFVRTRLYCSSIISSHYLQKLVDYMGDSEKTPVLDRLLATSAMSAPASARLSPTMRALRDVFQ
jgi:hypothetical protein